MASNPNTETANTATGEVKQEERKLTPAEHKKLNFIRQLQQFWLTTIRKPRTSVHKKISQSVDKKRVHAKRRRAMQKASRKHNRGRKGRTAMHHLSGS